jgi:hypothetical protein
VKRLPDWPGFTVLPGSFEFMALLGTPNGISTGWMIVNHAADLPKKTVTSITVFIGPGGINMDFELGTLTRVLERGWEEDLPPESDDLES